jgi:hypothetical protein
MPLFPATEAEARQMMESSTGLTLAWCERCRRLVIPLDRLQQFCPEDLQVLPKGAPVWTFRRCCS